MTRDHEMLDGDETFLGDADEMVEEEPTMCLGTEDEIASLRGEKCYLEYKAAELEGQVSTLRTRAAIHHTEDDRTIKRLEEELVAYREGMDQAKEALERTLSEKKELETKMKSSEAVFNERKRNFDHIITIFGEEKKNIIDAKQVLEERVQELEAENQALRGPDRSAASSPQSSSTLQERVNELETMLGQSGLARQEQEEIITQLVKEKADLEAAVELKSKIASEKDEDLKQKTSELTDLKLYMGKKSQQWETYKEEAAAAKKSLEIRFDERCKELDQMQHTLQKHKEYTNDVKRALAERESQIKSLTSSTANANVTSSTAYSDGELISLLEEKEKLIEDLTKQLKDVEVSAKRSDEMQQLANRNKSLEDEVMGLKSLVFKLEHRAYSKEPSNLSARSSVTAVYRNSSPGSAAMQRSGSTGRNGLKFPSPTRRGMMCSSPTGRGPVSRNGVGYTRAGGRSPAHRCSPSPRAVSPGGSHRGSLSSRAALSAAVTKASVNSIVVDSEKHRKAASSPSRKGYTTVLVPQSAKAAPGRLSRKSSVNPAPLSARSVNCDA